MRDREFRVEMGDGGRRERISCCAEVSLLIYSEWAAYFRGSGPVIMVSWTGGERVLPDQAAESFPKRKSR